MTVQEKRWRFSLSDQRACFRLLRVHAPAATIIACFLMLSVLLLLSLTQDAHRQHLGSLISESLLIKGLTAVVSTLILLEVIEPELRSGLRQLLSTPKPAQKCRGHGDGRAGQGNVGASLVILACRLHNGIFWTIWM